MKCHQSFKFSLKYVYIFLSYTKGYKGEKGNDGVNGSTGIKVIISK